MADLQLDTATDDIIVTNGKLGMVYDDDAIRQSLLIRLRHFKGEWFRDRDLGTDYFGSILGKQSHQVRYAEFRRVIIGTPGVSAVDDLQLTYDTPTRELTVEFTAIKDDGRALDVRFEDLLGVA